MTIGLHALQQVRHNCLMEAMSLENSDTTQVLRHYTRIQAPVVRQDTGLGFRLLLRVGASWFGFRVLSKDCSRQRRKASAGVDRHGRSQNLL